MFPDDVQQYAHAARAIAELLDQSKHLVLTTHVRPDGDAIGSLLGLGNALAVRGKRPLLLVPSPVPPFLRFLPGVQGIEVYDPSSQHNRALGAADAIVCLDFNTLARLDQMESPVRGSTALRILIDHHLDPETGFAAALHDANATSTAELVSALVLLEYPEALTPDVAAPLYTGILTDSGNFRFPRVSARTHRIVATLIEHGADPVSIYDAIFNTNTPARIRLLGEVLRTLDIACQGRCAVLSLSQEQAACHGATLDDTEGFVQHTLTIEGVCVGVFLSQMPGRDAVKVSLRSKGNVDVQRVAEQLGGGGHLNAAGAIIERVTLGDAKQQVLGLIDALLSQQQQNC
ncbi:MAG: exopolyphosphatase [Candidatus Kapaibacterium sp.]|nr:MAG: exopolyphosphatase [Candidatus Kapabacteria bacterium]